jgi:hypothetical protein
VEVIRLIRLMPGACDRPSPSLESPFSLSTRTSTQGYLQPPFVTMCVSRHCAPQTRFSYATVWGAYDMWMFRGSRSWSQWGVVRRFHVLLACRKFWFCYVVRPLLPAPAALTAACARACACAQGHHIWPVLPGVLVHPGLCGVDKHYRPRQARHGDVHLLPEEHLKPNAVFGP